MPKTYWGSQLTNQLSKFVEKEYANSAQPPLQGDSYQANNIKLSESAHKPIYEVDNFKGKLT